MNNQRDALLAMLPEIEAAARNVANKWPQVTTADDLTQDIYLRLLGTPRSVEKLDEMTDRARRSSLQQIGHQIASGNRDDYELFSGQFSYSVDDVRKLLESGVLLDDRSKASAPRLDLELALEQVNDSYREALLRKYVNGSTTTRGSTGEKTLQRAVDSLTLRMNRIRISQRAEYLNGGRWRSSVSSVDAQAETTDAYEGVAFDA